MRIISIIFIFVMLASCAGIDEVELKREIVLNYITLCKKIRNENPKFTLENFKDRNSLASYEGEFKNYGFTANYFYALNKKVIGFYEKTSGNDVISKTEKTLNEKTDKVQKLVDNPLFKSGEGGEGEGGGEGGEGGGINKSLENIQQSYKAYKEIAKEFGGLTESKKDKLSMEIIKEFKNDLDTIYK